MHNKFWSLGVPYRLYGTEIRSQTWIVQLWQKLLCSLLLQCLCFQSTLVHGCRLIWYCQQNRSRSILVSTATKDLSLDMKSYWLFNRRIQPSMWVHVYLIDHFIHDPVLSIQCWAIYKPTTSKVLKWQDSLIVRWWALWEQLDKELVMGTVVAKPEVCKRKTTLPFGKYNQKEGSLKYNAADPQSGNSVPCGAQWIL
jgi:hypothetical protein